jgi:poly-gamma-glutamate capsule biosynthesis protein CapA/YwtB (metallophosphatase superfamily)
MNNYFFKFFLPFFFVGAVLAYLTLGILENENILQTDSLQNNLGENSDAISKQDHLEIKDFYQTERIVRTVFLSQIKSETPESDQVNLETAAQTIFKNLQKDQQYSNIIVVFDPAFPLEQTDPFYAQTLKVFPDSAYRAIHPGSAQTELDIYNQIHPYFSDQSLIILHTYQNPFPTDPQLAELYQIHLKNSFDNFTKQNLTNLPFSNQEGLKAVYQVNKEAGNLKILPALENSQQNFQFRYLTKGSRHQSKIVSLTFFGDLMLGRHVRTLMDRHGLDYPFENLDQNLLKSNDLLIANLEGPVAKKAVPTSKEIAFRFLPDIIPLLKKYHFDAVSSANNHSYDMGAQGLVDTYELLPLGGISTFGHPKDLTSQSVWKTELNGEKFAFLGLNDTDFKLKKAEAIKLIQQLKAEEQKVIVYIHWGVEYQHKPQESQVELAHSFVDAGAAAVIGHHPHVVQSFEIYNHAPIFYSLGNAIFDQYFSTDVQEGLVVNLTFQSKKLDIYFFPIKIETSKARLMSIPEKSEFLSRLSSYWRYEQSVQDMIEQGKITIDLP